MDKFLDLLRLRPWLAADDAGGAGAGEGEGAVATAEASEGSEGAAEQANSLEADAAAAESQQRESAEQNRIAQLEAKQRELEGKLAAGGAAARKTGTPEERYPDDPVMQEMARVADDAKQQVKDLREEMSRDRAERTASKQRQDITGYVEQIIAGNPVLQSNPAAAVVLRKQMDRFSERFIVGDRPYSEVKGIAAREIKAWLDENSEAYDRRTEEEKKAGYKKPKEEKKPQTTPREEALERDAERRRSAAGGGAPPPSRDADTRDYTQPANIRDAYAEEHVRQFGR